MSQLVACVAMVVVTQGTLQAGVIYSNVSPSTVSAELSGGSIQHKQVTSLPASGTASRVNLNQNMHAIVDYTLSDSSFDLVFDLGNDGEQGREARVFSTIYFRVTGSIEYALTGNIQLSGGDAVSLRAQLSKSASNTIFTNATNTRSFQGSENTPNEYFEVGGTGGDVSNTLIDGSPVFTGMSGVLTEGLYSFNTFATITGRTDTVESAETASGEVHLLFGPQNASVPEPASLMIFGFGALGLIAGGVRRRNRSRS